MMCIGIGPRKFRTTASDLGDRSVWTDTPADRHRKDQVCNITRYVYHYSGKCTLTVAIAEHIKELNKSLNRELHVLGIR